MDGPRLIWRKALRTVRLFLALVICFGSHEAVSEETALVAATEWGLLGTWQVTCDEPVKRSNQRNIFEVRGGQLFMVRNIGGASDYNCILSANVEEDGSIALTIEFPDLKQTRENRLIKVGKRFMTLTSRSVGSDDYTIRDGKVVATGDPANWMTRCY